MAVPQDLKYTETHEWVRLGDKKAKGSKTKDKVAVIGITDYAVSRLSDLVHVELPKVGDTLEQGTPFGEVESVKTVAELISPLSGKVIEVNTDAAKHVDLIMEEPYEEGWLIKLELSDTSELESLLSAKDYEEYIKTSEEEGEEKGDEEEEIDEGFFM